MGTNHITQYLMDTSFLYHVFGVRGVKCTATTYEYKPNKIILDVEYSKTKHNCPKCGKSSLVKNGTRYRRIHSLPIGSTLTVLNMKVQRYKCKDPNCGYNQYEKITFVNGGKSYTRKYANFVVDLLRSMTIQDVALRLGVSWDLIKEIHSTHLGRKYGKPDLSGVEKIGIDEFAVRRGHTYKTIVVDLPSGRILYVGDGKSAESLVGFWKRVKKEKVNIKYVATDMSSAFAKSVRENAPEAVHVFDHFHVIKLMNDTVDKIRRDVMNKESNPSVRRVIKGSRFLLLANSDNVTDDKGKTKLQAALDLNLPLSQAYYLKEDLREIYNQPSVSLAEAKFNEWISMAIETDCKPLIKMADTLYKAKKEILAFFNGGLSTGKVEGINNKIKVLKRNAYGYRDDNYFTLRLYSLHDCHITRNVG